MQYYHLVNFVILNVSCIQTSLVLLPDKVFHCIIAHSAIHSHTATDDSVTACCQRQCDCHWSVLASRFSNNCWILSGIYY